MTRNCLNVMRKYANMDKEAGRYDKIVSWLMSKFPQMGYSQLWDTANKLYARRATRAITSRFNGKVQRLASKAMDTSIPGTDRSMYDKIVRDTTDLPPRFVSHFVKDNRKAARNFNYTYNTPGTDSIMVPERLGTGTVPSYGNVSTGKLNRTHYYGPGGGFTVESRSTPIHEFSKGIMGQPMEPKTILGEQIRRGDSLMSAPMRPNVKLIK